MKRVLYAVFFVFISINAFAASSTSWTVKSGINDGQDWLQVQAAVTCDASGGSYTTEAFQNERGDTLDLSGYYLYNVTYLYGATGMTDNSDLEVLEHSASGKDVLNGAGANILDNATNSYIQPRIGTDSSGNATNGAQPIYGPLYLKISNNSVNSATATLILRFMK